MAQAAELIGVGRAVTARDMDRPARPGRTLGVLFAGWRERARQQSQLEGYVGLQDVGRQTGARS